MVKNCLRLGFLISLLFLFEGSAHAQAVIGASCPASGQNAITANGTPVVCTGSPLVWTVVGGAGGGLTSVTAPTGNLAGFIQTVQCTGTGISVACPSISVTTGDMLFIGGSTNSGVNATSVTDNLGNVFIQVPGSNGTVFYAAVNFAGSDIVTLNFAASQTPQYQLGEYSGIATPITIDQTCFSNATNSGFFTSTCTNVTANQNELLIAIGRQGGGGTWSTFPPYILRTASSATNMLEDAFQPNAGNVAAIGNLAGSAPNPLSFVTFNALARSNPSIYSGISQGACSGNNCFQIKSGLGFGGPFDTRESLQGTWSSSGTAITCPDCNFSPAYNGMFCWGSPQSMQAGPAAPGTFTYSTPTTGTCTPSGSMVGSAAANGVFTFGHDDTTVLVVATAAMYNQPKCGGLQLPFARGMFKQGLSFTGTVAADCGVQIIGGGYATTLEMMPNFNFSTVTNNIGTTAQGIAWNTSAATSYNFFTLSGEYNSLSGLSTAPASALFTIGPGSLAYQVNLNNWATATSNGPKGANINGTGPFGIGFALTNWGDGNIWCSGAYCIGENNGGNATLKTQGASLSYDYSGTYGGVYTTGSGAEAHLFGTSAGANSGGFGAMSCDHNGGELVFLEGGKVGLGTPGASGVGFQFNNLGAGAQCKLTAHDTLFNGGASGSAVNSAAAGLGIFVDRGGNTFNGPLAFSGTYTNLTSLSVRGACTGTATAASTLGLYGTGPNVTTTTCTTTTIGSGIVMTKAYTIYELLVTATHAGVNASSGLVTVLKNGVAQTMVCTVGTGTACQDGTVAHQVTGSAGDLISLQFTTQAAEVLAGVQASLVIE